ncbi:hypothetical protein BOTBODRAFT_54475 [Botryobasidium botryosum FD-172 SS1]|uniref:Uncharacterized protein n=1 Tax=Botryobasidium botryosum (strain FD-172 SS1) TaxID=930990 RepID=A0A067MLG0_BOTB1|nr:hypothetical protein BOTBODRAFT_54475 [Botryobasidium botryosum FD-172 SS1]
MSHFDIIYAVLGVTAFIFAVTLVYLLVRHKDVAETDEDGVSIRSHTSFSQRGLSESAVLGGAGTAGGPTAPRVPEPAVLPRTSSVTPSDVDAQHATNIDRELETIYRTPPATANGVPASISTTPSSAWATNSSRPQTALSDGTTFSSIGTFASPSSHFQPIPHSSILSATPTPAQPRPHAQVTPPPPLNTTTSFPEEPPQYEP